jgi:HJR/Mrr/RecB family endonuclease
MLREYLDSKGLCVPADTFNDFLSVCALKRDIAYFGDRMQAATVDGTNAVRAYSYLFSSDQDDALIPFLQNYLCGLGQHMSVKALLVGLTQYRKQNELDRFGKDLEMRSSGFGRQINIQDVDAMDPFDFELLLGMIFETRGFCVRETPKTGDQGADVLLEKAGEATVIQAKLYSHPVSNSAVQEAVAAKAHFRCHHAMVVTNNDFTKSARELAGSNNVRLIGRNDLIELVDDFNRSPKDYGRLAQLMSPRTDSPATQSTTVLPPGPIQEDGQGIDSRTIAEQTNDQSIFAADPVPDDYDTR